MKILKYKDNQGNWVSVPALIGPKGDQGIQGEKGDRGDTVIIASKYSELTFPVADGTYCLYNDVPYVANQTISTSEAWTAAHWDQVSFEDEIGELKSALNLLGNANIDVSGWELGAVNLNNGTEDSSTTRIRSPFIGILKNSVVELSGNAKCLIVLEYNSSKTYRSVHSDWNDGNKYTVQNDGFIRIVVRKDTSNTTISSSDVATQAQRAKVIRVGTYYEKEDSRLDARINNVLSQAQECENDIDALEFSIIEETRNLYKGTNPISYQIASGSPSYKVQENSNCKSIVVPITGNKKYTVSKSIVSARFGVAVLDGYPENNKAVLSHKMDNDKTSITVTAGQTATYLMVYYYLSTSDTVTESAIRSTIQVEEGEVRTQYIKGISSIDAVVREEIGYNPAIKEKENSLVTAVMSDRDTETITFGIITDTHQKDGYDQSKQASMINRLCEKIGASAIIHLGDVIDGYNNTQAANKEYLSQYWQKQGDTYLPVLYAIGHHEMYGVGIKTSGSYYRTNSDTGHLDIPDVEGMCGFSNKWLNKTSSETFDNWYADINGIRFIGIDSVGLTTLTQGFSDDTVAWLEDVLANSETPIVVLAHVPCLAEANYNPTMSITNSSDIRTMLSEYTNGCIAYFHGHTHCDNVVDSTMEESLEFPLVSVCCGLPVEIGNTLRPTLGTPTSYTRVIGAYSEYCFDIVNYHKDSGTINIFRFGAGDSGTYPTRSIGNET